MGQHRFMNTYVHTYMHTYIYSHICAYRMATELCHMHVYIQTYTLCIHKHIQTYTFIHTHIEWKHRPVICKNERVHRNRFSVAWCRCVYIYARILCYMHIMSHAEQNRRFRFLLAGYSFIIIPMFENILLRECLIIHSSQIYTRCKITRRELYVRKAYQTIFIVCNLHVILLNNSIQSLLSSLQVPRVISAVTSTKM